MPAEVELWALLKEAGVLYLACLAWAAILAGFVAFHTAITRPSGTSVGILVGALLFGVLTWALSRL